MQGFGYSTMLFKDIFVDDDNVQSYEVFKNWYTSCHLSSRNTDVPSEKTFWLIAYNYNASHIAFSEESFKELFAIDIYTYYKEFEMTTIEIDKLMAMTDNEVKSGGSTVNNIANIPEIANNTDTETVDFITQQSKMLSIKSELQVRREQLTNKRDYTTKTFLNRFKHLFRKVASSGPIYVGIGEE